METFKFSKPNLNDIEFKLKIELGIKLNREYIYIYILLEIVFYTYAGYSHSCLYWSTSQT